MAQYPVVWDDKSNTLTFRDETDRPAKKEISHIYALVDGEIPGSTNPPQVAQHIENIIRQLSIDPRYITIKNNTKNARLDTFEKKGEPVPVEATEEIEDVEEPATILEPHEPDRTTTPQK